MEDPTTQRPEGGFPASGLDSRDLRTTANELYRRMGQSGFASEDVYWSSLPTHLRNFIRNALPFVDVFENAHQNPGFLPGGTRGAGGQKAMYALAQHIVHAANQNIYRAEDELQRPTYGGADSRSKLVSAAPLSGLQQVHNEPAPYTQVATARSVGQVAASDGMLVSGTPPDALALDHHAIEAQRADEDAQRYDAGLPAALPVTVSPAVSTTISPQSQVPGSVAPKPVQTMAAGNQPSSRAVGKQPMAAVGHNPPGVGSNTTSLPSSINPGRSARSAGKAPVLPAQPTSATSQPIPHAAGNASKLPANGPTANPRPTPPSMPASTKVWQTSTNDERQKIRQFWDSLGYDSRRKLLKVEREAVFRKMKEQQRHACDCAVCGRKRAAVEQELEVLYDSYSEELNNKSVSHDQALPSQNQLSLLPSDHRYGPFPGSVEIDDDGNIVRQETRLVEPGRNARPDSLVEDVVDSEEEYEDEDEDYEEEDEDDLGEDEDIGTDDADHLEDESDVPERTSGAQYETNNTVGRGNARVPSSHRQETSQSSGGSPRRDFGVNWGELASIQGGVLLAADDLMKNDCGKFLQMMEQLAEIRTSREIVASRSLAAGGGDAGFDDDYDDDLDSDDANETRREQTGMAAHQEGRRVFQIFAARLFEQRVLQAYREQLAQQKQLQFLRELEEEESAAEAREARKAKDAQKKKDKKKQQKQAKEDEKARREAAAAAEAEASRLRNLQSEREAARKREDDKQRKEAERRAKLEETQRKEDERRKRQQDEKDKEAERQRKLREREDRIKAERAVKNKEIREKEERERLVALQDGRARTPSPIKATQPPSAAARLTSTGSNASLPRKQVRTTVNATPEQHVKPGSAGILQKSPQVLGARNSAEHGTPSLPETHSTTSDPAYQAEDRLTASSYLQGASVSTQIATQENTQTVPADSGAVIGRHIAHKSIGDYVDDTSDSQKGQVAQLYPVAAKDGGMRQDTNHAVSSPLPDPLIVKPAYPSSQPVFANSVVIPMAPVATRPYNQNPSGSSGIVIPPRSYTDRGSMAVHRPAAYTAAPPSVYAPPFAEVTQLPDGPPRSGNIPLLPAPATLDFRSPYALPDPIGPIQPIGRPRPSNGDTLDSTIGPHIEIPATPQLERVLGSAALSSGDDEVIMPAPRRISHAPGPAMHWNHSSAMSPLVPQWGAGLTANQPDIWHRAAPPAQHPLSWHAKHNGQPQTPAARFDVSHLPPPSR